eukprot:m.119146 g.119146  ORF g.119146 m.119146 type:complete len:790 (+) comp17233_c0_seq8:1870-4239(+)
MALHTLAGVTEIALERARVNSDTLVYWEHAESGYFSLRNWLGGGLTDVTRWLLGYPSLEHIADALRYLRNHETSSLAFVGRVKFLLSTFQVGHPQHDAAVGRFWSGGDSNGEKFADRSRQRAIIGYKQRVLWLLTYSHEFLLQGSPSGSPPSDETDNMGRFGDAFVHNDDETHTNDEFNDQQHDGPASDNLSGHTAEGVWHNGPTPVPSGASTARDATATERNPATGATIFAPPLRSRMLARLEPANMEIIDAARAVLAFQRSNSSTLLLLPKFQRPSFLKQNRYAIGTSVCAVAWGAYVLYKSSSYCGSTQLQETVDKVTVMLGTFISEHMVEPVENIMDYILQRHRRSIAEPEAFEETKETLRLMLLDFVNDQHKLPPDQKAELLQHAERCDLRAISTKFVEEVRSPIASVLSGEIIRILLINAERMKLDMLLAMNTMDELMRENTTTIEMAAMIPIITVGWGVAALLRWLVSESGVRRQHRHKLRMLLRNIEATLAHQIQHTEMHRADDSAQDRLRGDFPHDVPMASRHSSLGQSARGYESDSSLLHLSPHRHHRHARFPPAGRSGGTGTTTPAQDVHSDDSSAETHLHPDSVIHPNANADGTAGTRTHRLRGTVDRYIDYGRLIFGVWMIENELRAHPETLNRCAMWKVCLAALSSLCSARRWRLFRLTPCQYLCTNTLHCRLCLRLGILENHTRVSSTGAPGQCTRCVQRCSHRSSAGRIRTGGGPGHHRRKYCRVPSCPPDAQSAASHHIRHGALSGRHPRAAIAQPRPPGETHVGSIPVAVL